MDSMSFIVGVKLSAAAAGVTAAHDIRTTLAATDMHERTSDSMIGLCMMPAPLISVKSTIRHKFQNFSRAPTPTSRGVPGRNPATDQRQRAGNTKSKGHPPSVETCRLSEHPLAT